MPSTLTRSLTLSCLFACLLSEDLYYPGNLRIRLGTSRFEGHAPYPRHLCERTKGLNGGKRSTGLFGQVYKDLKAVMAFQVWNMSDMKCLDELVMRCRRHHGALDVLGTVGKKARAYYYQEGVDRFEPPCRGADSSFREQHGLYWQHWSRANYSAWRDKLGMVVALPDEETTGMGDTEETRAQLAMDV